MHHQRQQFNRTAASRSANLLLLAAIRLTIPAIFHFTSIRQERELSLEIAVVLFVIYVLSLIFMLRTLRSLFAVENGAEWAVDEAEQGDACAAFYLLPM